MKEIRHYIKRLSDFPRSLVHLETLNPEALWNDALIYQTKNIRIHKEFSEIPWTKIKSDPDLLGLHSVLCYFFHEPSWHGVPFQVKDLIHFLTDRLPKLSESVKPYTEWTSDGERAEELVRILMFYLKLIPEGETEKYFNDRLKSIDTLERIQILEESKKSQERAQEILRKIRQAEEEEAASKYNRE